MIDKPTVDWQVKGQLMVTVPSSEEGAECSFCRKNVDVRVLQVHWDHSETLMNLCGRCLEVLLDDFSVLGYI